MRRRARCDILLAFSKAGKKKHGGVRNAQVRQSKTKTAKKREKRKKKYIIAEIYLACKR